MKYLAKKEKEIGKSIKKLGIEPCGVYHYDEQVLWVNTSIKLRMTIICATTNLTIRDEVVDGENFDKHTIKKNFKRIIGWFKTKNHHH
jgi:lysophospholipase L1-like esterase